MAKPGEQDVVAASAITKTLNAGKSAPAVEHPPTPPITKLINERAAQVARDPKHRGLLNR